MRTAPRTTLLLCLILANFAGGLALEFWGAKSGWAWAESAVSAATFLHLAFYFWLTPAMGHAHYSRLTLFLCLLLATLGELVLSAVLGLYQYRVSILPAFVPPGHVLLFLAGITMVSHPRFPLWLALLGPAVAAFFLAGRLFQQQDFLSLALYGILVLCLVKGSEKKLYGTMFTLALGLEFYGTWLGSWVWVNPVHGIPSANPPLAAGVFYAVLDLLVRYLEPRLQRVRLASKKS